MFLFSPVLAGGDFGALDGGFLPRVTWVHPSSSLLLGWFPVSVGCVSRILIFFIVFVVIDVDDIDEVDEAIAVADTNEAVAVVTAVLGFFVDRLWRSGLSVYSASIAASGLPPPPSWLDPCSPVYGVLPGNLLCIGTW